MNFGADLGAEFRAPGESRRFGAAPAARARGRDGFVAFHTSKYRLHYLETPSGLRLVLNTDLGVPSAREALQHIYSNLFVELVVKNPLCPPRAPVQSLLFRQRLDAFVRGLPYFGPRNPS
ncbi:trafficking protein particle complex subunit 1-like [Aphelocoma coerulescens]|uniref:trafficking protein particle complex subunit 1-like n=1 Tax=Aphelocoma coerulescens TaxID=39617 RepID=UPI003604D3B1